MQNELKDIVDTHGLFAVVDQLSGICGQISERCSSKTGAEDWKTAEAALDACASKILDLFSPGVTDTDPQR